MGSDSFPIRFANNSGFDATRKTFIDIKSRLASINAPISDLEYELWIRRVYAECSNALFPGTRNLILKVMLPPRNQYVVWAIKNLKKTHILPNRPLNLKGRRIPLRIRFNGIGLVLVCLWFWIQGLNFKTAENKYKKRIKKCMEWFTPILTENVNKESLSKYQHRIASDSEFQDKSALESEVVNTAISSLLGTPPVRIGQPGSIDEPWDPNYPEFTTKAKKWPGMLGIRQHDSAISALFRMLYTICVKDTLQVVFFGFQNSRIIEKVNYLTAGHIAHTRGYDRRRSKKALANAVDIGLVQKYPKSTEDATIENDIEDRQPDFRDKIEYGTILQQLMEKVTDPKDKLALHIYRQAIDNNIPMETEYLKRKAECAKLGLNSASAINKRLTRIPTKYKAQNLNPFN